MPDSLLRKLGDAIASYVGKDTFISSGSADVLAQTVLGIVRDHDRERLWPMAREDLISRLTLALQDTSILVGRDSAPGGDRRRVRALSPSGLALELARAAAGGGAYIGRLKYPEAVAESALEDITGRAHPMPDPEIDAIAAVRDALRPLPADTQMRIARYWLDRLQGGGGLPDGSDDLPW